MLYDDHTRNSEPITIVGAGISGLTAAIALAKQGCHCQVLERNDTLSQAGAGIQLGPNAVHIIRELDIATDLAPHTTQTEAIEIYDGLSGERLTTIPLGSRAMTRYGAPYLTVHRGDLQTALVSAAARYPKISLTTGFKVHTIKEAKNHVMITDEAGANTVYGAAVIAADGIWSHTRRHLFSGHELSYTGKTASRSLVPADNAPASFSPNCNRIWLAPNAHVVHYPVKGGLMLNVVAIIDEKSTEPGWNTEQSTEIIHAAFRSWSHGIRDFLYSIDRWRKWSLAELPILPEWSSGKIGLIGDAAHPVLPFLAQGGGLSIEDGYEVALCLMRSQGQYEQAWRQFYRHRIDRVQAIQLASRRCGEIYHLGRSLGWSRNLVLKLLGGDKVMQRYDWIYRYRSNLA